MASVSTQLAAKLRLEATLRRELNSVFAKISRDFAVVVASTGTPQEAAHYAPVWIALLNNHYQRAQRAFTGIAKKEVKQEADDEDNKELLALALLAWRNNTAGPHAEQLTATTRANMTDAIRTAYNQFAEDNHIPSDRELAAAAAAILRRKLRGRESAIAISETQAAAESTKFIEAEVESGIKPRVIGGGLAATTTRKVWRTVGDSKVRPIHRVANGQSRALTEPFLVNGELLMHPGDSSLGASAGNVANCRCVAQYVF